MNTDIRIAVSFKDHRKRKKLRILLGPGSTDYLIDLWLSTAMNHPSGTLTGMDTLDVALEAGWGGDPESFVSALIECGFLERDEDGTYRLHDWEDHQGYAVHAPERTERARGAARKRWSNAKSKANNAKNETSNADSMPGAMLNLDSGNAPSPVPSPDPSPDPVPDPEPEPKGQGQKTIAAPPPYTACAGPENPSPEGRNPEPEPDVTPSEREMLRVLSGARGGYRHDYGKDLAQVRALSVDFPRVDMLEEVKKMAAWLIDKPDSRVKNPRAFMRNWIVRAAKTHAAPNAPPSGDDGRTPAARASPDGIPDPDEIQRRFDAKYSRVEHAKHAKYAKTGGVVIDV